RGHHRVGGDAEPALRHDDEQVAGEQQRSRTDLHTRPVTQLEDTLAGKRQARRAVDDTHPVTEVEHAAPRRPPRATVPRHLHHAGCGQPGVTRAQVCRRAAGAGERHPNQAGNQPREPRPRHARPRARSGRVGDSVAPLPSAPARPGGAGSRGRRERVTGSTIVNVEPLPGSDSHTSRPSCAFTIRFTNASPSPSPPKRRVAEPSACAKSANTWSSRSVAMPTPRSLTEIAIAARLPLPATAALTDTGPPSGEYLIALSTSSSSERSS